MWIQIRMLCSVVAVMLAGCAALAADFPGLPEPLFRLLRTSPVRAGVDALRATDGSQRIIFLLIFAADGREASAWVLARMPDFPVIVMDETPRAPCGNVWYNGRYVVEDVRAKELRVLVQGDAAETWRLSEVFACAPRSGDAGAG